MKRTLLNLFSCCLLAVMASCGNNEDAANTEAAAPIEDTMATKAVPVAAPAPPVCPDCVAGQLCETACLNAVQGCHTIQPSEFTSRTTGYSATGYNLNMNVAALKTKMLAANCENEKVVLYGDADVPENTDIMLTIEPLSSDEKGKTTRVSYRIPLLRSICNANPQSILFHKGVKSNGYGDIIIAVKFSETDTRYFDLSDSLPPTTQPGGGKKSADKK